MKTEEWGQISRGRKMLYRNVHVRILLSCTIAFIGFLIWSVASQAQDTENLRQTTFSSSIQQTANPNQTDFEVSADATAESLLNELVPRRSDTLSDWHPQSDRLYQCGEPRILCPIIPPPPCHPTQPPFHFDLIGDIGTPTGGPLYNGPCCPRAGSRDDYRWPVARRIHDTFVDYFYSPNYWPK